MVIHRRTLRNVPVSVFTFVRADDRYSLSDT